MDHWMANTPVPATLLLITSDKDFAMALKKVERTGYNTILASDEGNVAQLLEYAASSVSRNANDDDLKKSYRRLAMKWHPVKNPLTKKAAEAKFKQISQAYDVLSDPQRRHAYDQHGGFDLFPKSVQEILKIEIKPRWKKGTKTTFLEKGKQEPLSRRKFL
ncbi:unnamed protein product [Brassica oleracea]